MKIYFEPNLKHQADAVSAVVRVFEGAPYTQPEERFFTGEVSSNVLKIGPQEWQANVAKVAEENGIEDRAPTEERDFTVEMETGTGKTYVYLRTIFELNQRYGLHKFIIVVPSVAIREGVLTTLRLTKEHFREIYATEAEVASYDSRKLAQVRSFCVSNHLSIMVMNKQAFDSDAKVINDENRDGGNLREMLSQVQPIIIMDEPQEGMDTSNMQARLAAFNPLFKLRYSATHKEPKNIVYRLDPYDAYNLGLVKKIAVLSIYEANTQSNVAVALNEVTLNTKKFADPTATLQLNVRLKAGEFKSKAIRVKRGDNLEEKTNNPVYHDWIVENIGSTDLYDGEGYVKFTNGEEITEGQHHGSDKETIFRQQIQRTIQTHFQRKKQLLPFEIKPLSLFFIDRVANYTDEGGLIRRLFQEEYRAVYERTYKAEPVNLETVHGGYFAKTSSGDYTDNEKSMASNSEIYDKILKAKETLLSFEEPLEFIFSHSALGVGWDNPNVFTICTLNESESKIKKRQEIGRGLRLCVDQQGKRYRDADDVAEGKEVNLLTIVPNQSYYAFASGYQDEVRDELGASGKAAPIRDDNRTPVTITRNEARFSSEEFRTLWAKIAQKTRCRVHFREDELIEKSVEALAGIVVDENRLEVTLTYWSGISATGIEERGKGSTSSALSTNLARVDVVSELARTTAVSETAARAILEGLADSQKRQLAKNPMQFLAEATRRVRRVLEKEMVRLVKYEKIDGQHPLEMFEAALPPTKRNTAPTPKRGLYDRIVWDSHVEKNFAGALDDHHAVRVFVKLPKSYKVPTPIGNYEPDFALVIEKRDLDSPKADPLFYFTVETKGTTEWDKLKPDERLKIECAVKHFEAIGLKSYLAPVEGLESFDDRARERIGKTFFDM